MKPLTESDVTEFEAWRLRNYVQAQVRAASIALLVCLVSLATAWCIPYRSLCAPLVIEASLSGAWLIRCIAVALFGFPKQPSHGEIECWIAERTITRFLPGRRGDG